MRRFMDFGSEILMLYIYEQGLRMSTSVIEENMGYEKISD